MTFTHVVTFKWRRESTEGAGVDGARIAEELRELVTGLDGVVGYRCGPDAGVTAGAYDFAVVGTFTDRDAFAVYRDHPEHQRILNELILPNIDTRTVVQLQE